MSIQYSTPYVRKIPKAREKNHSKGAEGIVSAARTGLGIVLVANSQSGKNLIVHRSLVRILKRVLSQ